MVGAYFKMFLSKRQSEVFFKLITMDIKFEEGIDEINF